ncbi:PEP-CTERM system TPR-repeat protein PrsT [Oxalobacteraceae bacterium]|nr:PEP-CTERM system TPR-repeat protein PrsT [Oxalobacteraceae bacterium]
MYEPLAFPLRPPVPGLSLRPLLARAPLKPLSRPSLRQLLLALPALILLLGLMAGCHRLQSSERLIAEARHYQAQGQSKAALIQLQNVLQREPANALARGLLGQLHLETGDALSAEKEFRRALGINAQPAEYRAGLGQALLMQGQFERVLDEVKPDPAQPAIVSVRADALLALQQTAEAAQLYAQALQLRPDFSPALLGQARIAMLRQQPEQAMKLLAQALAAHPADIDSLRMKGDILRGQGQFPQALRSYQELLRLRPEFFLAHIDIANIQLQTGKIADARLALDKARKLAPANIMVVYTSALIDFRERKLKTALEQLQQVLRAAPEHMPSTLLLAAVQLSLGALPQAEQAALKFLDANPGHIYASKLLARIALKNDSPEQALKLAIPILEKLPDDIEALSMAGEAQMRLRQFAKAAGYFERASKLAPQIPMLHAALGMSQMALGENGRAIAELERATTLDTQSNRAGVLLVLSQLRIKDYAKALSAVNQMERQQGGNPLVLNLKGGVLLANKDLPGARAAFEKSLAADPVYLPALDNLAQMDLLDKKPDAARLRYTAALGKDKQNPAIMAALAKLAAGQGQPAEAQVWLERAVREHPEQLAPALLLGDFYLRLPNLPKALQLAQSLQASNPANTDALSLLAEAQARSGQAEAALESVSKLAVLQPDSAEIQLRIAQLKLQQRDQAGALDSLRKALALQADYPQAQQVLATLLAAKGAYPQALASARQLQQRHPQQALGYKLEGDILMAQRLGGAARAPYEKAYALQPSPALLIPVLAAMEVSGQQSQAFARAQSWLSSHPADRVVRLYLASAYLGAQDYAAAITQLERVVNEEPNNAGALNDLAWAYQQRQDRRALATAQRAHKLAAANPAVLDTLGWILAEQGDTARALPLLRQASALAPQSPDIRYHMGLGLIKAGDKAGARAQLEQLLAVKEFSKRDEVKSLLTRL